MLDEKEYNSGELDDQEENGPDDEYFDKAWNNWSSRRRCESAHRAGKMDQFKKISKKQSTK